MLATASLLSLLPFVAMAWPASKGPVASGYPTQQGSSAPIPPPGGVGVSPDAAPPVYTYRSEFDFQSLDLALHQEWIELDLFSYGLERFSDAEFEEYGILAQDRALIQFMAHQEMGHATLISNMLGSRAAKQCKYKYDFNTVGEYFDFCQRLTRWGESGVYGFLEHLNSRPAAQLLLQSITTEARQQMIFRQFEGLFPMPVYFEVGIPQAWAWTLLEPYIVSCPDENEPIVFQSFPALEVENNSALREDFLKGSGPDEGPAITHFTNVVSAPGDTVSLKWQQPGQTVGPYNAQTKLGSKVDNSNEKPLYALWVNQLNTTYTDITVTGDGCGTTIQPGGTVYPDIPHDAIINGTTFVAITSCMLPVTPYNLSLINDYMVAGPAIFAAA